MTISNDVESQHPIDQLQRSIKEAHVFLSSLEEDMKQGLFSAQTSSEKVPFEDQPVVLEDDTFFTDWL